MLLYLFSNYCLLAQKNENWKQPKPTDSPLFYLNLELVEKNDLLNMFTQDIYQNFASPFTKLYFFCEL